MTGTLLRLSKKYTLRPLGSVKLLFLTLGILVSSMSIGSGYSDNEIRERALENLKLAKNWFITNGLDYYYKHSENPNVLRKFIRSKWAVSTFSGPVIESFDYDVRMILKSAGIYFEVISLHRVGEEFLYEYWVVKKSGAEWTKFDKSCEFIITKALADTHQREIIYHSNTFFESWSGDTGSISLPIEENQTLYRLAPWLYPNCYENDEMTNFFVEINNKGEYSRKKIKWWHRYLNLLEK